jgi:hypothetical protein
MVARADSGKRTGALENPTQPLRDEAADAGRYESELWQDKGYPKVQILTLEGLLNNTERVGPEHKFDDVSKCHFDKA